VVPKKKPATKHKPLVRYKMMAVLVQQEPLAVERFAEVLEKHHQFTASGGGGGRWETFVTPDDVESGLIIGVYVGQQGKETEGEQAQLEHNRLDGLDLRGVELPYANLCGVSCRGQDLSGANLEGSLITDSDFANSCFRGARLAKADFSRSELTHCDFREADLSCTDLDYADLSGSDLSGAKLDGAKLSKAKMEGVIQETLTTVPPDPLLWQAAREGSLSAVDDALSQGANINSREESGDAALNLAAEYGHLEIVARLLEAGADIENLGGADKTPLMNATFAGHLEVVDLLFSRGARISQNLLSSIQVKVNILEENAEEGMVNPAAAESWRGFLDYMVETWQKQQAAEPE
jgi:uncharacterized protein YjbI with pentapeptide repeats